MSRKTTVDVARLVVAANVVAAGAVVLPLPAAHANCIYQFPPVFEIVQTDGWYVTFPVSGNPRRTAGPGQAKYWMDFKPDPSYGPPAGGIDSYGHIEITVPWSNASVGKFVGDVRQDGIAQGTSMDVTHPQHNFGWTSIQPMECTNPAPAQPGPQQQILDEMIEQTPR